jgi:hypothetical protein
LIISFDSQVKDFIDVNSTNDFADKAQIKLVFSRKRGTKHEKKEERYKSYFVVFLIKSTMGGFLAPPMSPGLRNSNELSQSILRVIVEYEVHFTFLNDI